MVVFLLSVSGCQSVCRMAGINVNPSSNWARLPVGIEGKQKMKQLFKKGDGGGSWER